MAYPRPRSYAPSAIHPLPQELLTPPLPLPPQILMGGYKRTFKGCVLNVIRSDKETKRLVKIQKKRDNDDHFFFSSVFGLARRQKACLVWCQQARSLRVSAPVLFRRRAHFRCPRKEEIVRNEIAFGCTGSFQDIDTGR